jgi:hypothetical protein
MNYNEIKKLTSIGSYQVNIFLSYFSEIKVFGHYEKEFKGYTKADVLFNINNLQTRGEALQWYLELNSTGTPHKKRRT